MTSGLYFAGRLAVDREAADDAVLEQERDGEERAEAGPHQHVALPRVVGARLCDVGDLDRLPCSAARPITPSPLRSGEAPIDATSAGS